MKKFKTKQIDIVKFELPFESIHQAIFNGSFEEMCTDETFKIKKFLGSDWSIKDSGFIFYGPNKLEIVFSLIYIEINDFNRINRFLITHLNGTKFNEEINILFSIIKNTTDNTTIIELSIECDSDDILECIPVIANHLAVDNTGLLIPVKNGDFYVISR